mmetsp:Transcript_125081/g.359118  ORF Transcript_125081/g.359118 Transcript_125081/m.359118 type:complete len:221 (+) Transcript_125081:859-1521(+)
MPVMPLATPATVRTIPSDKPSGVKSSFKCSRTSSKSGATALVFTCDSSGTIAKLLSMTSPMISGTCRATASMPSKSARPWVPGGKRASRAFAEPTESLLLEIASAASRKEPATSPGLNNTWRKPAKRSVIDESTLRKATSRPSCHILRRSLCERRSSSMPRRGALAPFGRAAPPGTKAGGGARKRTAQHAVHTTREALKIGRREAVLRTMAQAAGIAASR